MLSNAALVLALAIGAASRPLLARDAEVINATQLIESYDFVIAGGGLSGLTVADRLTENPNVRVLVIEAGPFDRQEDGVTVPGAYFPVPYFWLPLSSTPQTALGGTVYGVPCGRVVGGGSVINAMFFHRSSASLYDAWASLGASGFGWKDLLPYFKKSETFNKPDAAYAAARNITWDDSYHGFSGPVQASHAPYDYPGSANFYNAARSIGIPARKDPNGGDGTGVFRLIRSVDPKTKRRSSARINHYERVKSSRPNYHILPSTLVNKVLFQNKAAIGVEYVTASGEKKTVYASKEVIVSAGAVHTPQILQLSGVGDAAYLKQFGIQSVSDLPGVGANLQDHLVLTVNYNYTNNYFPNGGSLQENQTYAAEQRAIYDAGKPSAFDLTGTTGNMIIQLPLNGLTSSWQSIVSLAKSQDPAKVLGGSPNSAVLSGYKKQRTEILNNINDEAVGDISWNTGPASTLYMTRPFSRGSIKINSDSISTDPLIDYGAIVDPTDLEILFAVYLKNRQLMQSPDIKVLGAAETSPAPWDITDKAQILDAIKKSLNPTNAHQCCTAAMMKKNDGGVVGSDNLVYGVSKLSVVDASVFPLVPGGGPQASIYGAAEKAVDTIKKRNRV